MATRLLPYFASNEKSMANYNIEELAGEVDEQ